jgi:hypothetical protein
MPVFVHSTSVSTPEADQAPGTTGDPRLRRARKRTGMTPGPSSPVGPVRANREDNREAISYHPEVVEADRREAVVELAHCYLAGHRAFPTRPGGRCCARMWPERS